MRSFVGPYQALASSSFFLAPLDDAVACRQSNEVITWSDDLKAIFQEAQHALIALSPFRDLVICFG